MPRRGRSMAPAYRPAPPPAPVHHAPPPPPAPVMAAPQQPGLFKQMAATAAGVAVGSAVGHTIGHAMTGSFGGGGGEAAAPAPAPAPAEVAPAPQPIYGQPAGASQLNPCEFEIKQFMDCAQHQGDITLCTGFNEAIKLCKQQNGISI